MLAKPQKLQESKPKVRFSRLNFYFTIDESETTDQTIKPIAYHSIFLMHSSRSVCHRRSLEHESAWGLRFKHTFARAYEVTQTTWYTTGRLLRWEKCRSFNAVPNCSDNLASKPDISEGWCENGSEQFQEAIAEFEKGLKKIVSICTETSRVVTIQTQAKTFHSVSKLALRKLCCTIHDAITT
jgi:hypothetical protein